ncbi:MAG TPA: Rne/Rng family ribonuclease [Candidatus Acidoferrales bacterium]|nr:Rne/Rng family ribonuclease [Candidatus Acidoferrales bacterium]
MSKELIISSTPHETRVAILEDGQLCEIYIEREKEFALVGSIYKGRVTRVLPGMQSAFVDIGLDTDAFLYVSDVLEELEEDEQAGAENQGRPVPPTETVIPVEEAAPEPAPPPTAEPAPPVAEHVPRYERPPRLEPRHGRFDRRDRFGPRGRRGRSGGRNLPPSKYAPSRPGPPEDPNYVPIILPGESLAKYKDRVPPPGAPEPLSPAEVFPAAEANEPTSGTESSTFETAGPSEQAEAARQTPAASEPESQAEEKKQTPAAGDVGGVPSPVAYGEEPPAYEAEASAAPGTPIQAEREPEAPAQPVETAPVTTPPSESRAGSAEADELSFEETAAITETLAEVRQAEVLQGGERESNGAELEPGGVEIEPETVVESVEAPSPEIEPEPATVRLEQPLRSPFQRPMSRERHRGGRRLRHPQHDRQHHHAPSRRPQQISDLLKAGQEVIIQINKEPLGKKGARITSHVALPGRFLVYMPTLDHVGISRKIGTVETRGRLRHLVESLREGHPGGFIARTAAAGATEDDIRADAEYLTRTWQEIRAKAEQRRAPSLLHRDLNLVERLLRDCLNHDFVAVWVDSEEEYTRVVDFVSRFQPDLVSRVKLYTKETPIFEEMGVQQEMDKSLRPKVWLKSGGYIVINHTEALVAIDVNTGKYVGRGSNRLEDTIVKTNIDAVKEIVRQIRLRDLGGIIVIDFIDMEERRNREKVLQALADALRADRAPSKVLPFNEFGLVAITRKRTKQALERVLCQPCPYCTGSGMVKSVPTICFEIDAEARKMAGELDAPSLTLRVHPEIAKALKTREAGLIEELERAIHKNVVIQADPTLHWEQYDLY